MSLLSHAGFGTVGAMLALVRCLYRVMLVTMLPSHIGKGTAESVLSSYRS
jgi:hypothetical protein